MRVLVVEDDVKLAALIQRALRDARIVPGLLHSSWGDR
jgi:DNA-binding response OmpR family regulator